MKEKIYVYSCENCKNSTINFHGGNCMNCFQPMQVFIYAPEQALDAAEQRGYEKAREQAAKIVVDAPWKVTRESVIKAVRAMQPKAEPNTTATSGIINRTGVSAGE